MDKILIKRGMKEKLEKSPPLSQGELFLSKDEERLYVGGPKGNIPIPTQQDVDEKYQEVATKLEHIAVNIMDYGAVGDGVTDDSDAIIEALKHGRYVLAPQGKQYAIYKEIEIPFGRTLDFNNCRVNIKGGKACFNISPGGRLKNARFHVDGDVILEKSLIYFDGNKRFIIGEQYEAWVENVYAQRTGTNKYQGTFIWFHCEQKNPTESCFISGVKLINISSMRFEYGIRQTAIALPNATAHTYITANVVDGYHAYNPINFIWQDDPVNEMASLGGNIFNNIQCQPADDHPKVFLCITDSNIITNAIFWDIGRPSNDTDQIIIKGGANYIHGFIPAYPSPYYRNEGKYNLIVGGNPAVPGLYAGRIIAEEGFYGYEKDNIRPIPHMMEYTISTVESNDQTGQNMSSFYKIPIPHEELVYGYNVYTFEGYGTAKRGTYEHRWRLEVANTFGQYEYIELTNVESFYVTGKAVFRKYRDEHVDIRVIVKIIIKGQEPILLIFEDKLWVESVDNFDVNIQFGSSVAGNLTRRYCEYRKFKRKL